MYYPAPPWHSFSTLALNNEAVCASACCKFSFATLEVAGCLPGMASFALTEKRQMDVWRWAICSLEGVILQTGCEPTQTGAKKVAEKALQQQATREALFQD